MFHRDRMSIRGPRRLRRGTLLLTALGLLLIASPALALLAPGQPLLRIKAQLEGGGAQEVVVAVPGDDRGYTSGVADAACELAGGVDALLGGRTAIADTACLLRSAELRYVTEHGPEDQAPLRREHRSVVGVPTPLDVDANPGADLVATVRPSATGAITLQVDRAQLAGRLPVAVKVVANDPKDTTLRYELGYDGRRDGAPGNFAATVLPSASGLKLDVTTGAAGPSLQLVGRRYAVAPDGAERDPVAARVRFAPVPPAIGAALTLAETQISERTAVELTTSRPSTVTADVSTVEDAERTDIDGVLHQVDGTVGIDFVRGDVTGAAEGERATDLVLTQTTTALTRLEAEVVQHTGDELVRRTVARLEDLPSRITAAITPEAGTRPARVDVDVTRGQEIGLVDVALADGEPRRLTDDAYALVVGPGGGALAPGLPAEELESTAVRIRGLRGALLKTRGENVHVDVAAAAQPFRVRVEDNTPVLRDRTALRTRKIVDARVADLPAETELTLKPATGRIDYLGSAVIDRLNVALDQRGGGEALERTTVGVREVPGSVDMTLLPKQGEISYTASGSIASVDVALHDAGGIATGARGGQVAKDLTATMTSLPTRLDAHFSPTGTPISVEAREGVFGRLSVLLTSGPNAAALGALQPGGAAVAGGAEGAVVRDRADDYVVLLRLARLRGADVALDQGRVDARIRRAEVANLALDLVSARSDGAGDEHVHADVTKAPSCLRVALTDARVRRRCGGAAGALPHRVQGTSAGAEPSVVLLDANGSTERVQLDATNLATLPAATPNLSVTLAGVPDVLEASLAGAERIAAGSVGGALGSVAVKLSDGSAEQLSGDGIFVRSRPGEQVVFARARDLREAGAILNADGRALDVLLRRDTGHDLAVDVLRRPDGGGADEHITGTVTGAPRCLRVAVASARLPRSCSGATGGDRPLLGGAEPPTVILWEGDGTTTRIDLTARNLAQLDKPDPLDLQGEVDHGIPTLQIGLDAVPRRLETLVAGRERIQVQALPTPLGRAEVRLAEGLVEALPATTDGVYVRDLAEGEITFARLSQLDHVEARLTGGLEVLADAVGARPFRVDLVLEDPSRLLRSLAASVETLRPNTTLRVDDTTPGEMRLHYDADATAGRLRLDTNMGAREFLRVRTGNLPETLDLCVSTGLCGQRFTHNQVTRALGLRAGDQENVVTVRLDASSPVFVDVHDCVQRGPNNAACTDEEVARADFTKLDGTLEDLVLQQGKITRAGDHKDKLPVYVDTGGRGINVRVKVKPGEGKAKFKFLRGVLRPNLAMTQRFLIINEGIGGVPVADDRYKRGSAFCPEGSDLFLAADALGFLRININFIPRLLCNGKTGEVVNDPRYVP